MHVNETISIIIPVYNVFPFVERCLDSVVNQTYGNMEIILVDDCSTDNSNLVCESYAYKNKNIQFFRMNKNMGLSYVRNFGINKASGSYIGFVDSDDWISENMYEFLYHTIKNNNAQMVICNFKCYYDEYGIYSNNYFDYDNDFFIDNKIDALIFCLDHPVVWNKLYEKDLFKEIRFPVGKIFEDSYVTHLLVEKAEKIAVTTEPLYFYNIRNGSISRCKSKTGIFDSIYGTIDRYEYLIKKYNNTTLEMMCRKRIFYALLSVVNKFNESEESNILNNELSNIHNFIFTRYSHETCGFDMRTLRHLNILKTGFKIYKKINKQHKLENYLVNS